MFLSPTIAENNIEKLKEQLTSMNEVTQSSCVAHEMRVYCSSLNLKKLKNCADQITDENIISKDLDVEIFVATLMENENAILNLFEEMDLLRGMDMGAWNVFLLTPDLPPVVDTTTFIRTPLPNFRDKVEKIIETREAAIKNAKQLATAKSKESAVEVPVDIL